MRSGVRLARDAGEYAKCLADAAAVFDVAARLPARPFRGPAGAIAVCEFDDVLALNFGSTLEPLVARHGDRDVTVVVLEPELSYYVTGYSSFPAFRAGAEISAGYREGVGHEPGGDPTGTIQDSADVVAVLGSSGRWGVWAQRDWEVGVLFAPDREGWPGSGVRWRDPGDDLTGMRSPAGWGMPLTVEDLDLFRRNLSGTGSP